MAKKKKIAIKKAKPIKTLMAAKKPATKPVKPIAKKKSAPLPKPKKKPTPLPKQPVVADEPSLGRPLVTAEEKLYMLFREDYEARQVFEFLRVESVGDLVKLSAEEIVRVLTAPVRRTINRIRQRLAEKNRSLQGDEAYTREHQAKLSN